MLLFGMRIQRLLYETVQTVSDILRKLWGVWENFFIQLYNRLHLQVVTEQKTKVISIGVFYISRNHTAKQIRFRESKKINKETNKKILEASIPLQTIAQTTVNYKECNSVYFLFANLTRIQRVFINRFFLVFFLYVILLVLSLHLFLVCKHFFIVWIRFVKSDQLDHFSKFKTPLCKSLILVSLSHLIDKITKEKNNIKHQLIVL
jgi:hypothetical protein